MAAYSFDQNSSIGQVFGGLGKLYDPFSAGFNGSNLHGGSVPRSLVLDNEKVELVKAPDRVGNKEASKTKAVALKNHKEAERRRRERINAHLDTLRGIVPCNGKIDKATLLAEVISQVKELKKNAMESTKGFLIIPMDADEVTVEPYDNNEGGDANLLHKASICCEYRPEIMSDLRQALDSLPLRLIKAEISTLGCRLKHVFVFTTNNCKEGEINNNNNAEASRILANAVHQALDSVLEKASPSLPEEYAPRTTLPNKRQRISFIDDSSSSSSSGELNKIPCWRHSAYSP